MADAEGAGNVDECLASLSPEKCFPPLVRREFWLATHLDAVGYRTCTAFAFGEVFETSK